MKRRKPPAGALQSATDGFSHLPFVPGVSDLLNDPEARNHLLLLEWEGEAPSAITTPHGSIFISRKLANSPIGLDLTAALVAAAVAEALDEVTR